jgi:hypothetical protein
MDGSIDGAAPTRTTPLRRGRGGASSVDDAQFSSLHASRSDAARIQLLLLRISEQAS